MMDWQEHVSEDACFSLRFPSHWGVAAVNQEMQTSSRMWNKPTSRTELSVHEWVLSSGIVERCVGEGQRTKKQAEYQHCRDGLTKREKTQQSKGPGDQGSILLSLPIVCKQVLLFEKDNCCCINCVLHVVCSFALASLLDVLLGCKGVDTALGNTIRETWRHRHTSRLG
ncbi:UNVERIFIED_CONTAM: hypothetical protein FKN15_052000 [Acipenser sinensis]